MAAARFLVVDLERSLGELFAAAEQESIDLACLLDILEAPYTYLTDEEANEVEEIYYYDDLIYELVEHAGLDRAQQIASKTTQSADLEVPIIHACHSAYLAASEAVSSDVPLEVVFDLITKAVSLGTPKESLWWEVVRMRPVHETARMAGLAEGDVCDRIGELLRQKCSAMDAFNEMVDCAAPAEDVVLALVRFWQVTGIQGEGEEGVLSAYACVSRDAFQSLNKVIAFASERGDAEWWIPILRQYGLRASQATLFLLEEGKTVVHIICILAQSGFSDDEVLSALLENACGQRSILRMLFKSNWSIHQLTCALRAQGSLPFEVRDSLMPLGYSRSDVRSALLSCWPQEEVELTI